MSIDPNIRPALLPGPGEIRPRFEALVGLSHVVKLSDEDAEWLYPGRTHAEVVTRVLALGPALAVISRGSEGALLASSRCSVEVLAPAVAVVDTIGAGDAFMGGLLHQLLALGLAPELIARRGLTTQELDQVGCFAANVAALTVSRRGADPPYLADVAAYERRVRA